MGKTLTWTILGINKASPAFKEIAKDTADASKKLDSFGKDGSKSLGGVADAATQAKKAAEDMAVRMSSAVEKASEKLAKARDSEADQLGRLRVAKESLIALEAKGTGTALQKARAEEAVAAAMRRVEAAQKAVVSGQDKLNSARDAAIAQARKEFGDATAKVKLDIDIRGGLDRVKAFAIAELKSAGLIAGAAMGGGIAAGLSTVGAAGLFIGIAAAAQSSNENVAASYSKMWEQVKAGAYETSGVLADDFIAGAEKLGQTFNTLKPQMAEAFTASQPAVNDLFDGVSRLATEAMPGLVTAAKASSLATDNVAAAMESTGRAVSNFFIEASEGAEAGGESIEVFGRIVERLGSFAGRILADLANNSATVFPALEGSVDAAAGAVENLAHSALPALASGAALGLSGLTLLLNLANSLITVLGPLAPHILTVVAALKLVSALSFGGVGKSWDTFKQSIADAPGVAGKAKAGMTGLVGSLGPIGLAAGIGALALDSLSRAQQKAAQEAAGHKDRVQTLADALRATNGAIDDNVQALADKKLRETEVGDSGKNVVEVAKAAGINIRDLTDAYLGNESAQTRVSQAMREFLELNGQAGPWEVTDNLAVLEDMLPGLVGEFGKASKENEDFAKSAAGAAAATKLQEDALRKLNEAIIALVNKDLGYRNSIAATTEAQKTAADALKEHGIKSTEFADASRGVESALGNQIQAAYDLARANSVATTALGKEQDATIGMHREILGLAAATGGTLPRALGLAISQLSNTQLEALGATRKINEMGQEVIRLPDGKTVTVKAEDRATATIQNIAGRQYSAVIKLTGVWAGYSKLPNGVVLSGSSAFGNAEGGWINGPGTGTSDSIPRMLSNGEFVVNAKDAASNAGVLEAINSGRSALASGRLTPAGMGGGMSGGGSPNIVVKIMVDGSSPGLIREIAKGLRHDIQATSGLQANKYWTGGRDW